MTKKRFKLSMAALGLLAAFFMVLIAVLLAPTLASANKDGGKHHHGMPGAGYPNGGAGGAAQGSSGGEDWNAFANEHGNAHDMPLCADGGIYPCAIIGDGDDAAGGGHAGDFEHGYSGGGNPQGGQGSHDNDGRYTNNYWGGGGSGGGAGGGGNVGPGGDSEKHADKTDDDSDDQADNGDKTGDKADNSGPEIPLLTLTEPEDDQPNDFVDPDFGDDEKPKTDDTPKDDNTPITEIAVTEVPEPLTLSLFAVGLAGAAGLRRRSRKA